MKPYIIEQNRERQDELVADSQVIMAAAEGEKRDLTKKELATIKLNTAEFDRLTIEIEGRETIAHAAELSRPLGRQTEPDDMGRAYDSNGRSTRPRARVLGPVARHSETNGFNGFGQFVMAVRDAGSRGGTVDERLMAAAASTWGNESSGTDGGFAVPPDFRAAIMSKAFGEDSLLARTMQVPVAGNSLTFPTAMTTPWGAGGIQANWEAEAAAITQSKPVLQDVTVRLHKLACLVPVSDELMQDAPAMGVLVAKMAGEAIDYKLSDAIANGNGVGQPLGFRNSAVMISQAQISGQSADTIVAGNCAEMASRLPVASRVNAVWLIHPDAEPQLPLMTIGEQPVYMPPGGMRDSVFGRLLGRPVIPHQVCQTVGDAGDIMLVDLSQYLTAVKAGGLRAETSIHLWFDQDLMAFRFIVRVAGQPWWSEVTSAANGSYTMSPFVQLEARTG
jgi:HK97 family phage major capsid protein